MKKFSMDLFFEASVESKPKPTKGRLTLWVSWVSLVLKLLKGLRAPYD